MSIKLKIHLVITCLISIISSFPVSLQAKQIKGIVYEDINKNLVLDNGEKGIPDVLVSNQREVVQTDENGRYEISLDDEAVIFVTKPAGYITPLNENNLSQFYYIHQPKGSPDQNFRFKGIAPTGKVPQSINFPLFKTTEQDTFQVIAFADPQPRDQQEIDFIRDDIVAELIGTPAVCGITLGDITFDDLSNYDRYNKIVARIGVPFYNVPGNHDENYDSPDDRYATETFKKYFGPNYYSFDYGKVHLIVLDDVEYLGRNEKGNSHYQGKIGEKQLHWLRNDLSFIPEDRLIVLTMHIPLYTFYGSDASINVVDREALFEVLKNRDHVLVLAGHMHNLEHNFIGKDLGWQDEKPLHQLICAAVCGTWWSGMKDERGIPIADQRDGTPNGYHVVQFEGNQYRENFKAAKFGSDFQLRISSPTGKMALNEIERTMIIANVFDGSEKSKVEFQIDELDFQKMQQTFMRDPFYERIYEQVKDQVPSWISPDNSTHIWIAPLPNDLKLGVHKIVVKTVDQFGNRYHAAAIFEIE